jgi:hypothetical protein
VAAAELVGRPNPALVGAVLVLGPREPLLDVATMGFVECCRVIIRLRSRKRIDRTHQLVFGLHRDSIATGTPNADARPTWTPGDEFAKAR